ncbi:homoserine O-succinyltransferase [Paracoccus sp. JM45]|uniref:homoserine O-succinyltransferase n=1 Tax=Paracoccus sp. JM45 TaxID=2283626 RepID=UPI000E6C7F71|nr:homoserine O-succinyltransferase [Paracoccus sp. JM45]RJE81133.1 homoserine O-succinyltransferase [Paracoccus sp. JM45]
MPITLNENLPAYRILSKEGVMVMSPGRAATQDIRPLRIGLLNLMPKKIQTENQFARVIGATPLQIDFQLIRMSDHESRNTAADHMESFYRSFREVEATGEKFDGLVITGAPIEHLDFDQVTYWDELARVFEWTRTHVHSTFGVCWGGMAMAWHFHGLPKHILDRKAFGCFSHQNLDPASHYLRGFSDEVMVPVSRWTEVRQEDVDARPALTTLLSSPEVGPCLLADAERRGLYVFNHFEYDNTTLKDEYDRDIEAGKPVDVPLNYFPENDPSRLPPNRWRSHAHLLYGNWINEIYQTTVYDMSRIGEE